MISIIIATLNRADALKNISLPSLLRQDFTNGFEVIVWDASKDDKSERICRNFLSVFTTRKIALRYFKAPRIGSSSQRNDALREAQNDVVFFIDDDCEISIDGVTSIDRCFKSFPWLYGIGLPMLQKNPASKDSALLRFAAKLFGMKNSELKRKINKAGGLSLPIKDIPGLAEWLSGGSMAMRKKVFEKIKFDERLETFGGYALGEDVDFSHRVMLEFGQPLMIANGGYVVHHATPGDSRGTGINKIAAYYHNAELIRRNFSSYGKKFGYMSTAWGDLSIFLMLLKNGASLSDIRKGKQLAKSQLLTHEFI